MSEENLEKASSSAYWAWSIFRVPATFELGVLGLVDLQGAGDLLHGLDLRAAAHTGDADTHVDSRADALVEQAGLQVDLAIGDGNNVGGDIGRHVAGLRLDDREGG